MLATAQGHAQLLWRFARSRGGLAPLVGVTLLSAVLMATLPRALTSVPFRETAAVSPVLVVSLVGGIGWSLFFASPWRNLEACVPRGPVTALRAAWFASATALLVAGAVVSGALHDRDPSLMAMLARNVVLAIGLAAASACALPRTSAWVPLTLFAGVCWMAGTIDADGSAHAWALPLVPVDSASALLVATATWLSGGTWYVVQDGAQIR